MQNKKEVSTKKKYKSDRYLNPILIALYALMPMAYYFHQRKGIIIGIAIVAATMGILVLAFRSYKGGDKKNVILVLSASMFFYFYNCCNYFFRNKFVEFIVCWLLLCDCCSCFTKVGF
ncbi:drug/metabolite transporter (DMT)-like permease [Pedobacter sp. UYP30]